MVAKLFKKLYVSPRICLFLQLSSRVYTFVVYIYICNVPSICFVCCLIALYCRWMLVIVWKFSHLYTKEVSRNSKSQNKWQDSFLLVFLFALSTLLLDCWCTQKVRLGNGSTIETYTLYMSKIVPFLTPYMCKMPINSFVGSARKTWKPFENKMYKTCVDPELDEWMFGSDDSNGAAVLKWFCIISEFFYYAIEPHNIHNTVGIHTLHKLIYTPNMENYLY